jgi:hypothetical protein
VFGDALHVRVPDAAAALYTLSRALAAEGLRCTGIEPIAPTLEDVFVYLVGTAP